MRDQRAAKQSMRTSRQMSRMSAPRRRRGAAMMMAHQQLQARPARPDRQLWRPSRCAIDRLRLRARPPVPTPRCSMLQSHPALRLPWLISQRCHREQQRQHPRPRRRLQGEMGHTRHRRLRLLLGRPRCRCVAAPSHQPLCLGCMLRALSLPAEPLVTVSWSPRRRCSLPGATLRALGAGHQRRPL
jgi:hypothetical protein